MGIQPNFINRSMCSNQLSRKRVQITLGVVTRPNFIPPPPSSSLTQKIGFSWSPSIIRTCRKETYLHMAKLFNSLKSERTGNNGDVFEHLTESETQTVSRKAKILIKSESCSGLNDIMKEVNREAESHPVIVPPGENKALYDFAEISRALCHAEKQETAWRLKTKPRNFEKKQRKLEKMIMDHAGKKALAEWKSTKPRTFNRKQQKHEKMIIDHAGKKMTFARGWKGTKPRTFKRTQRKPINILEHKKNEDLENDVFTLEAFYWNGI